MSIKDLYNEWSSIYDSNENKTRDLDLVATQTVLSRLNYNSVLELGCGTGKNTTWLSENAEHITAIDFSKSMLEKARSKDYKNTVEFVEADLLKSWPIGNQTYDLVTINLVLEHIENLNTIFHQSHRHLKDDGYLFVSELHPFKQFTGSKARFELNNKTNVLEVYSHSVSEFFRAGKSTGFELDILHEWHDKESKKEPNPPRLISFLFKKKKRS